MGFGSPTLDVAFTVTWAARPPDCSCVEAAGFTWCCGPRVRSPL